MSIIGVFVAVQPLDDELGQVVNYIRAVAIIVEAINEAFRAPDALVELAQGNQAGVRGNLTFREIPADSAVMTEGECCLDLGLCSHGRSVRKWRFGALLSYFAAPA